MCVGEASFGNDFGVKEGKTGKCFLSRLGIVIGSMSWELPRFQASLTPITFVLDKVFFFAPLEKTHELGSSPGNSSLSGTANF